MASMVPTVFVVWEQYPLGNPIIYSQLPPIGTCEEGFPEYARLFRDPTTNTIYLMYARMSSNSTYDAIYLYRLEGTNIYGNRLKNGDIWTADVSYWQRYNGSSQVTNMAVYRNPQNASDGNQYLEMNCGGSTCQPGQSIYQDVDVTAYRGYYFTANGLFKSVSGSATIMLTVFQLDANYNQISNTGVTSTIGVTYRGIYPQGPKGFIDPSAKYLRYQVYLLSPGNIDADEMLLWVTPP